MGHACLALTCKTMARLLNSEPHLLTGLVREFKQSKRPNKKTSNHSSFIAPSIGCMLDSSEPLPRLCDTAEQGRLETPLPPRRSTSLPTLSPTLGNQSRQSRRMSVRNGCSVSPPNPRIVAEVDARHKCMDAPLTISLKVSIRIQHLLNLKANLDSLCHTHDVLLQSYPSGGTVKCRRSHRGKLRSSLRKESTMPTRHQIEQLEGRIKQLKRWQKDAGRVVENFKKSSVERGTVSGNDEVESGTLDRMLVNGGRLVERIKS